MLPSAEPEATVVVCEDDAPTLDLLCDHLEADRFARCRRPAAADALRLCHYNQPDLLLLDLRLPDASGLDVLREIRASEGPTGRYDPALPVIVLSRPRHRRRPRARLRRGRRRLRRQALPLPGGRGADPRGAAPPRLAARGAAAGRRPVHRSLAAQGARRRPPGRARQQGVLAAARAGGRPARACSPRRSCFATSGDFARWAGPAPSTRTPAGCGESSTPRPGATWSTAGASATG